jgi:endonuclease/exonuclease/phosphatase family metal-dependent hydrolase
VARHPEIVVRALSWNLFHGRDDPPATRHSLRREFIGWLAQAEWDVALLQEAPPRWFEDLCAGTGAIGEIAKTSRNQLAPLRDVLAEWRPDIMKSQEGGSNQILVRHPWRIAARRRLTLAWLPERRRMLWLQLVRGDGAALCVATLHASAHRPQRAAREVEHAARTALRWSEDTTLVFGGDFNVRPAVEPALFERLEKEYGFAGRPTGPHLIDHLLARALRAEDPAHQLERPRGGELVLSDHAPVAARFME